MTDSVIEIILILFVLSLVSERIANFIKLYFYNNSNWIKKIIRWVLFIRTNTRKKNLNDDIETKRQFDILKINLVCSFLVAVIIEADLIQIFYHIREPYKCLGYQGAIETYWHGDYIYGIKMSLLKLVGWFLTACFVSLGSKFWHDLLDTLFAIKNAKNLLNQEKNEILKIGNWDTLTNEQQKSLIYDASKAKYEDWKLTYVNINGVDDGLKVSKDNKETDYRSIQFFVSRKLGPEELNQNTLIQEKIQFGGYSIPTDVIERPHAIALNECVFPGGDDSNTRKLGSSISRKGVTVPDAGTICLMVNLPGYEKPYNCILSCMHVLFPNEMKQYANELNSGTDKVFSNFDSKLKDPEVLSPAILCNPNSSWVIGRSLKGAITSYGEAGIAEISDLNAIENRVHQYNEITGEYDLTADDIGKKLKIIGSRTGAHTGILKNHSLPVIDVEFPYPGIIRTFNKLIEISDVNLKGGDSGAPVLDSNNRIVGMVIAGVPGFAYAVSIKTIQLTLGINIIYNNTKKA